MLCYVVLCLSGEGSGESGYQDKNIKEVKVRVLVLYKSWNESWSVPPEFQGIIDFQKSDVIKFSPPVLFYDVIFSSVKANVTETFRYKVFCLGYMLCAEHCCLIGYENLFFSTFLASGDDSDDIDDIDDEGLQCGNDYSGTVLKLKKSMSDAVKNIGRIYLLCCVFSITELQTSFE